MASENNNSALPITPALLALNFLFWAIASWGRGQNGLVDSYQTLYIFKAIAEGETLYRDVSYFFGPFAPYFHGGLFNFFGLRLEVLYATSLLIGGVLSVLLFVLIRDLSCRKAAYCAVFIFVNFFCFNNIANSRLFNFVMPYNFSSIYALLFLVAALWMQVKVSKSSSSRSPLLILWGVLTALVLLNRLELGVLYTGLSVLWLLLSQRQHTESSAWFQATLFFLTAFTLTFCCFGYFVYHSDLSTVFEHNALWFGHLPFFSNKSQTYAYGLTNQEHIFGFTAKNLLQILMVTACQLIAILPLLYSFNWRNSLTRFFEATWLFWLLLSITAQFYWVKPGDIFSNWQIVILICGAILASGSYKRVPHGHLVFFLNILSVVLLARIFFLLTLSSYFFYLGVIPLISITVTLSIWVRRGTVLQKRIFATYLALFCLVFSARSATLNYRHYRSSTLRLSSPVGTIKLPTTESNTALISLYSLFSPKPNYIKSLLVLPEGTSFNFLADYRHPIYFQTLLPHLVGAYGEKTLLDAIKSSFPDAIIYIHRPSPEYGNHLFSFTYANEIGAWINENYVSTVSIGPPPFQTLVWGQGGATLYLRKNLLQSEEKIS
jgi:hypothetical protein